MTPEEIISYCQANDIRLEPTDKGTIIIDIPDKSVWSNDLTEAISKHKAELIHLLYVQSTFSEKITNGCGNNKCLYKCPYIGNIEKCPWNLSEGTYRWKDGQWGRVLH